MKQIRFIYIFLIAMLFGFALSSCDKDDVIASSVDDPVLSDLDVNGTTRVSFQVNLAAPQIETDVETDGTRASAIDKNNADIITPRCENGGCFQNIVIVLVGPEMKTNAETAGQGGGSIGQRRIYGVHCMSWDDNIGVTNYSMSFDNVDVPAYDVTNGKKYSVYAFGNIHKEHFDELCKDTIGRKYDIEDNRHFDKWTNFQNYCINPTLKADDLYNIQFVSGTKHYYDSSKGSIDVSLSSPSGNNAVTCVGMPVNNKIDQVIKKGATRVSMSMKRVCARLKVEIRNLTGQYLDYKDGNKPKDNSIFVDNFELKNVLAKSTEYFWQKSKGLTDEAEDFKLSEVFKNVAGLDKNHIEVKNTEYLVVSMYVFENRRFKDEASEDNKKEEDRKYNYKGDHYKYNLKVDRHLSYTADVREIDPNNVYVLWQSDKSQCVAFNNSKLSIVTTVDKNAIPYKDQIFWKFETGNPSPSNTVTNFGEAVDKGNVRPTYAMKSYQVDADGKFTGNSINFPKKTASGNWDRETSTANPQYIWTSAKYDRGYLHCIYLCEKDDGKLSNKDYYSLIIARSWDWGKMDYVYYLSKKKKEVDKRDFYDWKLYAKYTMRLDQPLCEGISGVTDINNNIIDTKKEIVKIERNNSYELNFSIMPNEINKNDLQMLVRCKRPYINVDWSEMEK